MLVNTQEKDPIDLIIHPLGLTIKKKGFNIRAVLKTLKAKTSKKLNILQNERYNFPKKEGAREMKLSTDRS